MEIIHISAECYPIAKVGGLADVVGALAKYQNMEEHSVKVFLPCYETKFIQENKFETIFWADVELGQFLFPFKILKEKNNSLGFELYLIVIQELFDRQDIYGYKDDIERFLTFQKAFLDWLLTRNEFPAVINCHDHHTALIPFMITQGMQYEKLKNIPTLLTIHTALYQGQFSFDKNNYLPDYDVNKKGLLEWDGCINSLAAGLRCARAITTVSPNYLNEVNISANGLEYLFNETRYKSKGILSGIDYETWNPTTDTKIEVNFSITNFSFGKRKNKEKLCDLFNLSHDVPLISYVGRLLDVKGADLLCEYSKKVLQENANKINILILGKGNITIEKQLSNLLTDYQKNYNIYIGFNEELAHLIYAGSDFLLIPSRTESCGLNQMYAYRYGAIPIVRRTGGLKDTVIDIEDNGQGICFENATVEDMITATNRALVLFENEEKINLIIKSGMTLNHSWKTAYQEYLKMYNLIIK
ncbi:glycogen synthase [Flavobacterium sp. 7A]|uniref:glycogen synthase n=1 Tax=Flavobacterium sp. 7A TaxID=2940571 RepID=UPI002226A450|nr:glycogen/starch synthase [Flavobacterium sp. 7A]MCW2118432.1 starch synthase [Flavobacterium sp. 7A]